MYVCVCALCDSFRSHEALHDDLLELRTLSCIAVCKSSSDLNCLGLPPHGKSASLHVSSDLALGLRIAILIGGWTPGNVSVNS